MPEPSGSFPKGPLLTIRRLDVYFILQAQLPPIIRAGYNIRKGRNHGIEPDAGQVVRLKSKADYLRTEVLSWYHDCVSEGALADPVEVQSGDPTSPFETVLEHRNPWEGCIILSYWASLLILEECLNQCHSGPGLLFSGSQQLADNILRSMEYVGQGLMGPHRLGYPLRVAYDFADRRSQLWMLSKVSSYNDIYAALSADVYPDNPLTDQQSSSQIERIESQPLSWID